MGRVIVFGSINMDCVANVKQHPKSGETILGKEVNYFPGGKGANQAVASARLGAETLIFGVVGNDGFATTLINFLKEQNINISNIAGANCSTGTAFIAVDSSGENTIIVISGANEKISFKQLEDFTFQDGDVLVCQNEIPSEEMVYAFNKGKNEGALIVYNPAPAINVSQILFDLADYLIVNETEAQFYKSKINTKNNILIETKGSKGVCVATPKDEYVIEGKKVNVVDTTGAGDCFTGAFAAGIAKGFSLKETIIFANKAASLSVQKNGAGVSMPYLSEIKILN